MTLPFDVYPGASRPFETGPWSGGRKSNRGSADGDCIQALSARLTPASGDTNRPSAYRKLDSLRIDGVLNIGILRNGLFSF